MAETTTRIYELQVKLAQESLRNLQQLQKSAGGIEKQMSSAMGTIKTFGASLAGAFSVGALIAAINSTIDAVDELAMSAQQVGIGVETFSALAYAAEQSDMATADLVIGMKELQKSMVEIGTKGANVLDALGIDKSQDQVAVLKDFAKAFETIKDPALRTTALLEVFGKSGLKLRPLLEQGAAGIEELMTKAKELGIVVDQDVATAFSDLDNTLKTSQAATAGLVRQMALGLAPAITDVADAFLMGEGAGEAFSAMGTILGGILRTLAAAGLTVANVFQAVGTTIAGVAAAGVAAAQGNFAGAAEAFKAMNADLSKQGETYNKSMDKIFGLAEATDKATGAADKNTKAIKNNDAAVRAALTGKDKAAAKALADAKKYEEETAKLLLEHDQNTQEALFKQKNAWEEAGRDVYEATRTPLELLAREQDRLNMLLEKGAIDWDTYSRAVFAAQDAYDETTKKTEATASSMDTLMKQLIEQTDQYASKIAGSLVDFAMNSEDAAASFGKMVESIIADLAKMATEILIVKPLMDALKESMKSTDAGSIGGWLRSLIPNAKGGAYSTPSLSQYSNGVYNKPQFFAQGGVFAEAGPEAIMPLTRMPGGNLGVETSGGGDMIVNITNESKAEIAVGRQKTNADGSRSIEIFVRDAVAKALSNGSMDAVMGVNYGLNRRGG